jgi:glycosyltransferase involved in cell wall biosynthesis
MECKNKPTVLVLISYYIPAYKAGGPLRTIANMVDHLSDTFNFKVITRDRDIGDTQSFLQIKENQWQRIGKCSVYYLNLNLISFLAINKLIANTPHDILYLNSFFDLNFTIKPLIGRKFKFFSSDKVILAPRGEFSKEALKLKSYRKIVFFCLAKFLRIYNDLTFQASSEYEEKDIRERSLFKSSDIQIALDLPLISDVFLSDFTKLEDNSIDNESLNLVFLSRISPMKNLDFALNILSKINRTIIFHIYGPIEDLIYWRQCQNLIKLLPSNIKVDYKGSIQPQEVSLIFSKYDLFFLPSRGENYGHVIAESLSCGTPVLISNNTPWKNLNKDNLGWEFDLNNVESFIKTIEEFNIHRSKYLRKEVRLKISERLKNSSDIEANIKLFTKK